MSDEIRTLLEGASGTIVLESTELLPLVVTILEGPIGTEYSASYTVEAV